MDRVKGIFSQGIYSRRELDNSSKPKRTRAKGSPPEKHFTAKKKELLPLSRGELKKGVADDNDDDETQSSQSQVHVTAFRGTEGLAVKSQFK